MADEIETPDSEEPGGTLADAIAAHLALKKEHGADEAEIEHELEDALSPPTREPEPAAEVPEPEPEIAPEPEPEIAPEPAPEPAPPAPPEPEPAPAEPEPEPVAVVEDGSEADPDPITEAEVASSVEEPRPGEITGTIEFEFGEEEPAKDASEPPPLSEHDLLEDTPDFFEETPEHDKLWFDEAPPRKFDF